MNLLRKLLRGIYYFCVGIKTACSDLIEWYTSNKNIPRPLRNRASLLVLLLAVAAGGWGLASMLGSGGIEGRQVSAKPDETSSSQEEPASSSTPEQSEPEESTPEPGPEEESSSEPAEQAEKVDAVAAATRYQPITAEKLSATITERVNQYYEAGIVSNEGGGSAGAGVVYTPPASGDIAAWKAINPDVRGWISISNTNISYPVVVGPYTDYYTHRDVYKNASRNGCIWFDSDTRFDSKGEILSQNAVIYGHNWTNCWRPVNIGNPNDVMFAQLAAYDNAAFAAANPYIRVTTQGGDHLYQVFSVFYTTLDFAYNYADGSTIPGIISTAKAKSIHNFNVSVGSSDQFITLSTCTRILGQQLGENQRFVVIAKKIS